MILLRMCDDGGVGGNDDATRVVVFTAAPTEELPMIFDWLFT